MQNLPLDIKILVHDLLDGSCIVGDVGIAVDGVLDDGTGYGDANITDDARAIKEIMNMNFDIKR